MSIILFVLVIIVMFYFGNKMLVASKNAASSREKEVNELKSKITLVTTSEIPNKTIVKTLGVVVGTSTHFSDLGFTFNDILRKDVKEDLKGTSIMQFHHMTPDSSEKQALLDFMRKAEAMGANAIINVSMDTSSIGGERLETKVKYTGTAVVVH